MNLLDRDSEEMNNEDENRLYEKGNEMTPMPTRKPKPLASKPLNLKKLSEGLEHAIEEACKPFEAVVHARIIYLVEELAKYYPITGLDMGMGIFVLRGGDFDIQDLEGEEDGKENVDTLLEPDVQFFKQPYPWVPKPYNMRIKLMLDELWELCSYLNDSDNPLAILDYTIGTGVATD